MKRLFAAGAVIAVAVAAVLMPTTREAVFEFVAPPRPITLVAFGDMMLDRGVRTQINKNGLQYPFKKIKDLVSSADIAVVNAEGPFTHNESVHSTATTSLRFTFDPALLATLKEVGFDVLAQANNHTLDFGQEGLEESKQAIAAAGLGVFGDPLNRAPVAYVQDVRGTRVAFVGYHQFFTPDDSVVLAAIVQAKREGGFVVVYPHWGEEYLATSTEFQRAEAHKFVDAGADVVLGAHPHVAQPVEVYKGRAIFYSLGNFVFDQNWSKETSQGVAIRLTLSKNEAAYEVLPFAIVRGQPQMMEEVQATEYLAVHGLPAQFVLQRYYND